MCVDKLEDSGELEKRSSLGKTQIWKIPDLAQTHMSSSFAEFQCKKLMFLVDFWINGGGSVVKDWILAFGFSSVLGILDGFLSFSLKLEKKFGTKNE